MVPLLILFHPAIWSLSALMHSLTKSTLQVIGHALFTLTAKTVEPTDNCGGWPVQTEVPQEVSELG
jgi:hypothetical protein